MELCSKKFKNAIQNCQSLSSKSVPTDNPRTRVKEVLQVSPGNLGPVRFVLKNRAIKDISTYMQYLPATQRQTSIKKTTNPGRQNRPTQDGSYHWNYILPS